MEWVDWTWKVKVQVGPMSPMLLEMMGGAEKNPGKSTRELLGMVDPGELDGKWGEAVQASSELYSTLAKYTDGEAGLMVKGVAELDGLLAWGTLNKQYSQRTIGRMFRVQRECMYPKQAKNLREVGTQILEWEGRWRRMMAELGTDVRIPDLWRMSALLEICPRGVREAMELQLDVIGESYEVMKTKVIAYVTNRVEGGGGAVPMEVDGVLTEGGDGGMWWGGEQGDMWEEWGIYGDGGGTGQEQGWSEVGAVYPTTQCYNCGKFGHMARECPGKGKSKGKGKDGGKSWGKGYGAKAVGKGGWKGGAGGKGVKAGGAGLSKGDGKGGGKAWHGKGYFGGYQGTCYRCGQVGHKAVECGVHAVGEVAGEAGTAEEVPPVMPMGGVWTIAAVENVERAGAAKGSGRSGSRWVSGGRKRKGRRGCAVGAVNDSGEGPKGFTILDMMPRRVEVNNMFGALGEEEEEEAQIVGEVGEENVEAGVVAGVVEVMVDSGASKSVWPTVLGGVTRRRRKVGVRLAAANGSPIEVDGDAALHFKTGGRECTMNFLDADVRRPLGAVSAIVDGGNTVVFSARGSVIVNDATGERIPLVRKGGVYVMAVEVEGDVGEAGGGRRTIGGVDEEEKGGAKDEGGGMTFRGRLSEEDMGVFRRQA